MELLLQILYIGSSSPYTFFRIFCGCRRHQWSRLYRLENHHMKLTTLLGACFPSKQQDYRSFCTLGCNAYTDLYYVKSLIGTGWLESSTRRIFRCGGKKISLPYSRNHRGFSERWGHCNLQILIWDPSFIPPQRMCSVVWGEDDPNLILAKTFHDTSSLLGDVSKLHGSPLNDMW